MRLRLCRLRRQPCAGAEGCADLPVVEGLESRFEAHPYAGPHVLPNINQTCFQARPGTVTTGGGSRPDRSLGTTLCPTSCRPHTPAAPTRHSTAPPTALSTARQSRGHRPCSTGPRVDRTLPQHTAHAHSTRRPGLVWAADSARQMCCRHGARSTVLACPLPSMHSLPLLDCAP